MIEPVIIGNATIIHGDCMELMATLEDKAFDLAIVDPPYGINVNHNMGRRKGNKPSEYKPAFWDNEPPPFEYFLQLKRVSNNQIVWGANHFIEHIALPSSCWIIWDKLFSNDVSFASAELAYTSFDSVTKKFTLSPVDATRIHPTQKPVALYEWLLTNYAKQGDTILDTHLGSGSSAIAANKLGFKFTGIELDADYFQAACKRIEKAYNQQDLFAPTLTVKPTQEDLI
jgi:site-specific DNA-methyltransferase (adenine-specific)